MKMRFSVLFFIVAILIAGCTDEISDSDTSIEEDQLTVVATYSVIYDIVKNVGGDLIEVHSLAPIGSDPHAYEPLPADVQLVTDADMVFYNGFNLESGNGWFDKMIETAGKSEGESNVVQLSEGVTPELLQSGGQQGEEDPHAWLDVQNGIKYTEKARDALMESDPENELAYKENAEKYIQELKDLDEEIKQKVSEIPEEKRFLVTSEGAFKYFSSAYGFQAAYIWEINDENEGTPQQIQSVVDLINEKAVTALFLESSVDPRSMETVSNETDVDIAGKIFTDSLGEPGEEGDTYIKMIKWNVDTIIDGLSD
ncbi:metal ABC transporter substrate-binding protein [Virgibacillus sp. C22-A2]|uniref:Metal ABC transporter substrate-binding protein n=1 Tax=Virgibacillus tibetensis TaxID=3042313 RepID=A0ABU6KKD1_9BACI|nr:metal ABC transporter substrate-binding protein [Virgibacillus sp. C22-A2]